MARWSWQARLSLGFLSVFCAAMAAAVWSYSGGSWLHPHATGHAFFENYWCDLLREPAHNGRPNTRSVALATAGFVALGAALCCFWREIARLLPAGRGRFVRVAGPLSALATALVALVPSDRFPVLHPPVVLTAGTLGFACGCVGAEWALRRYREQPVWARWSLLLVAAATVNLVLYVRVAYLRASDTLVLPASQKLATLALVAWMIAGLSAVSASRPKP